MAKEQQTTAPKVCGMCPFLIEAEEETGMFGLITLYRCGHAKGPIFVMPSELSEHCPLEHGEIPKESNLLPSPGQRVHLSEETAFMIEALRWYASANCTETEQASIDRHLGQIWTDSQFNQYLSAISSMKAAFIFQTIYRSIVGYQAHTQEATQIFIQETGEGLFDEEE